MSNPQNTIMNLNNVMSIPIEQVFNIVNTRHVPFPLATSIFGFSYKLRWFIISLYCPTIGIHKSGFGGK